MVCFAFAREPHRLLVARHVGCCKVTGGKRLCLVFTVCSTYNPTNVHGMLSVSTRKIETPMTTLNKGCAECDR